MVSDDDLNRAMTAVIGWRRCSHEKPAYCEPLPMGKEIAEIMGMSLKDHVVKTEGWANEITRNWVYDLNTDYCGDRRTHYEIKQAIEAAGAYFEFSREMRDACIDLPEWSKSRTFTVTFAEPRLVVIAALKALGKMPEGEEGA